MRPLNGNQWGIGQLIVLFVYQLYSPAAYAAELSPLKPRETYTFVYENDLFGTPTSDRDYTMGMNFSRHYHEGEDELTWHQATLNLARALDPFEYGEHQKSTGTWWNFGIAAFTPQNITDPAPIQYDRPYASLVYLSAGYSASMDAEKRTEKKLEWTWGLLGTNIGYVVQRSIHGVCCPSQMPHGWSHQIGNGGSPTFLLEESWKTRLGKADSQDSRYGVHYSYGYSLGYYTRLLTGISFQYGSTPADYLAQNDTLPTELPPSAAPAHKTEDAIQTSNNRPSGFSFWARYEVSYFIYNELLQGAWSGKNDVRFRHDQITPVVHHINLGVELSFLLQSLGLLNSDEWRFYYTQQWSSREIKTYPDRPHSWGGLYIAHTF